MSQVLRLYKSEWENIQCPQEKKKEGISILVTQAGGIPAPQQSGQCGCWRPLIAGGHASFHKGHAGSPVAVLQWVLTLGILCPFLEPWPCPSSSLPRGQLPDPGDIQGQAGISTWWSCRFPCSWQGVGPEGCLSTQTILYFYDSLIAKPHCFIVLPTRRKKALPCSAFQSQDSIVTARLLLTSCFLMTLKHLKYSIILVAYLPPLLPLSLLLSLLSLNDILFSCFVFCLFCHVGKINPFLIIALEMFVHKQCITSLNILETDMIWEIDAVGLTQSACRRMYFIS